MTDVYKSIEEYNPGKATKVRIVFDGMIADMISNKNLYQEVTGLFIRGWKVNICLMVITQSYFLLSKDVRRNTTYFFIMQIQNRQELRQIEINHLSDAGFNELEKFT